MAAITAIKVYNVWDVYASYTFTYDVTTVEKSYKEVFKSVTANGQGGGEGGGLVTGLAPGTYASINLVLTYDIYKWEKEYSYYVYDGEGKHVGTYSSEAAADAAASRLEGGSVKSKVTGGDWEKTPSSQGTVSKSISCYTHPEIPFILGSYQTNDGWWAVYPGLSRDQINWPKFNEEAGKWRAWKYGAASPVSAFSSGILTAGMLSSAYAALDGTSGYSAGDPVSKAMFSGLETLMDGTSAADSATY